MTTKQKLQKLNKDYFDDSYFEYLNYNIESPLTLSRILATYLYDADFDFLPESWMLLKKIGKIFGSKMEERVLKNLFYRNHDT